VIVLGFSGIADGDFYFRNYGLRFVGHDSAVALLRDGEVLFAVEEERLSRKKHTSALPVNAVRAALAFAKLRATDVDVLAYPWNATARRVAHMFLHHPRRIPVHHWPALGLTGCRVLWDLMSPRNAVRHLESRLGERFSRASLSGVPHHQSHAACAFLSSGFDESAVLTVDGQGEDESASLGFFDGFDYRKLQVTYSPDSIGLLYAMVTDFLGMRSAWDEYKVMGMAHFGDPARFKAVFDRLVTLRPEGRYRTLRTAMVFKPGYCDAFLARQFGVAKREAAEPLRQEHFDLAAGVQKATEEVLFHLLRRLRQATKSENLCLAGGVFQNSVANGKIRQSGVFTNVHIPSVPGDHGGALGAGLWVARQDVLSRPGRKPVSAFLGPGYGMDVLNEALGRAEGIAYDRPSRLASSVANLLAKGLIVGWFQGRCEYGPRALGNRSILADPRRAEMKDIVNERIKHREPFRPFAGAVPLDRAPDYFELSGSSPFMQFVVPIRPEARERIPAVSHGGTCRVQTVSAEENPAFHELLVEFGKITSVPILLNTSFNDADEPIVCSPSDALKTFLDTDLDGLVIGPYFVHRSANVRAARFFR